MSKEMPFSPDKLPHPYEDWSQLNWEEASITPEDQSVRPDAQLLVMKLNIGLEAPIFIHPETNQILEMQLGWFDENEIFTLQSGWTVNTYNSAQRDGKEKVAITSLISRERQVDDTKLESGYLIDPALKDLLWHIETQNDEEKFRIGIGTNLHSNYEDERALESIISWTSKVTGHQIRFNYDSLGTVISIELRRVPLGNQPIIIRPDEEDYKKTGEDVGVEISMSLFGEFVDLDNHQQVSDIYKFVFGITPKQDHHPMIDVLTTMKTLIQNIQLPKDQVSTNLRGLISFEPHTIDQDIRAFAS